MGAPSNNAKTPPFDRVFFEAAGAFKQIGTGNIGGKAAGLRQARRILRDTPPPDTTGRLRIEVPSVAVIASDVFDRFMHRNELAGQDFRDLTDERIGHRFLRGDFPAEYVGDLRSVAEGTAGNPLAVRSSSLLEDALDHPFAGVYQTKMIPNNHPDPSIRFQRLVEAVKFVYASTFFRDATRYLEALGDIGREEKMAVVIQEVVGVKVGTRFYPHLSGVCRSFNFYRSGAAQPEEGVVNLALGLGKTIVDGGVSWAYSPAHPAVRPPFSTTGDLLKNTQLRFWAVNVGAMPPYDPTKETEYLVECTLEEAEYDNTLVHVASTYDPARDRIVPGVGSSGARVLDFAPLLQLDVWPINEAISHLIRLFESEMQNAVEIEFAVTFPNRSDSQARFAVLQVRPMLVSREMIDLPDAVREATGLIAYSDRVMGNGRAQPLTHIVYVKPGAFERHLTPRIATELEAMNRTLRASSTRYLLIGFGRWGSSDPWLGIPVTWGQISGAAVIVEATLPGFDVEPSQGAHFFHNIAAFRVGYFSVHHETDPDIAWEWLDRQRVVTETETLRHVEIDCPLEIVMDGRSGRGAILYSGTTIHDGH